MEETNNKVKIFWISLVFVILSVGVASFIFKDWSLNKKLKETKDISTNSQTTVYQDKAGLENRVSFPVKIINNSSDILESDLSRELALFIVDGANGVEVKKETYNDGKNGWIISYVSNSTVLDTYRKLQNISKNTPYTISSSLRKELASLIITESDKYIIKILSEKINDNSTKVVVTILEL